MTKDELKAEYTRIEEATISGRCTIKQGLAMIACLMLRYSGDTNIPDTKLTAVPTTPEPKA
jgi:hypothetical protein